MCGILHYDMPPGMIHKPRTAMDCYGLLWTLQRSWTRTATDPVDAWEPFLLRYSMPKSAHIERIRWQKPFSKRFRIVGHSVYVNVSRGPRKYELKLFIETLYFAIGFMRQNDMRLRDSDASVPADDAGHLDFTKCVVSRTNRTPHQQQNECREMRSEREIERERWRQRQRQRQSQSQRLGWIQGSQWIHMLQTSNFESENAVTVLWKADSMCCGLRPELPSSAKRRISDLSTPSLTLAAAWR
jgi:hypothetical protein